VYRGDNTDTKFGAGKPRIGLARCVLAACLVLALFVVRVHAAEQRYDIDIPALNVDVALKALAGQTEAQLLFPYDVVKTLQANPVRVDTRCMRPWRYFSRTPDCPAA